MPHALSRQPPAVSRLRREARSALRGDAPTDGSVPQGRWSSGPSIDGKGEFTMFRNEPLGDIPVLGAARLNSGAETQQIG